MIEYKVICDVCGKEIADVDWGMVVFYFRAGKKVVPTEYAILHKNTCDKPIYHPNHITEWMELKEFLDAVACAACFRSGAGNYLARP